MSSAWVRRGAAAAVTFLAGAVVVSQTVEAARKFTLVYNVNNAGYIDVCGCKHKEVRQGSITRRTSFLRQLRGTGRELLILDGGSSLFPVDERIKDNEMVEAVRKAELIVEAYNRMGYRAMAVGSADPAAGFDALRKLQGKAKFPFLSANLVEKDTGKPLFPTHVVVEAGGIRVGIFGLTLNTMSRAYVAKVAPEAAVADPLEAAKKVLDELRGKADLVVALSHLREETTSSSSRSSRTSRSSSTRSSSTGATTRGSRRRSGRRSRTTPSS